MKFVQRPAPAILALTLVLLACARTANGNPGLPPGESTRTLTHGGIERSYILHMPATYDSTRPVAVVLVFHGGGGNAHNAVRVTGFNEQSDRSGFLAVYPNGTGRLEDAILTWNGGDCCGYAQERNVDDVGFVRALLADLESIVQVDPQRVYATGMSNGAIFSYRLACEMSGMFAAIGPVAGTLNVDCQPAQPVSVIHFHGTSDRHLPYVGGVGEASLTGVDYASVSDSIEFWSDFDACTAVQELQAGIVTHLSRTGCAPGTAVELYTLTGGLHAWPGSQGPGWPGGDTSSSEIDATQIMWEFFAAHPKQ